MLTQLYCPTFEAVLRDVTVHAVAWTSRDVHMCRVVGESLGLELRLN